MVVRKTMVDVSRCVICTWRFVWGERGRGPESCWGWSVGDARVAAAIAGSSVECEREGASEVDMMRGMSDVERYMIKSFNYNSTFFGTVFLIGFRASTAVSPTLLGALQRATLEIFSGMLSCLLPSSIVTRKQL